MKQVKFLNEADRPKEEKPLTFTEWAYGKGGYAKRLAERSELHEWFVASLNNAATEYAAYLASFPTEKKKVEFTHLMVDDSGYIDTMANPNAYEVVWYLGKCIADGGMFAAYSNTGAIVIFKGHLNSSYY